MRDAAGELPATAAGVSRDVGLVVPKRDLLKCLYLFRVLWDDVALLLIGVLAPGEGGAVGIVYSCTFFKIVRVSHGIRIVIALSHSICRADRNFTKQTNQQQKQPNMRGWRAPRDEALRVGGEKHQGGGFC